MSLLCMNFIEGVQILLTLPPGVSSVVLVRITMENGWPGGNGPFKGAFSSCIYRHDVANELYVGQRSRGGLELWSLLQRIGHHPRINRCNHNTSNHAITLW